MEEDVRLNKYLSSMGVCSRREADRLIESGAVTVDGRKAVTGQKVMPGQKVAVKGRPVEGRPDPVLLLVNKPAGVVCTTARFEGEINIVDMVDYPTRVYPIGRLDKNSEGLILMTDQGDLVNKISRRANAHEKEYAVKVDKPVTPQFIQAMESGVPILDTVTAPCKVRKTGTRSFNIILTQGLNRQIRRMCEYFDYRVRSLKRIRVMSFTLDGIPSGGFREATPEEWERLKKELEGSSNGH